MRWQLILDEFSPEIVDINGSKTIVVDVLSCEGKNKIRNKNIKKKQQWFALDIKETPHD